jgi:N-glycosylase/DNA lyase
VKLTKIPAPDFDLAMTLDSGQVFHWEKVEDGFIGTISHQPVYAEQRGTLLFVTPGTEEAVRDYLALDHPLARICASFPDDPIMNAARDFCRGLRIIRQGKWECLATFICSSMKQVAHIRQISRKMRERFGEPRQIGKHVIHTFPLARRVAESSEKELRECALGYRARNLLATAKLVSSGEVDLKAWAALSDPDLRTKLCALPGVGAKVANCVMLFAYERLRAFPVDVWIERVLKQEYFSRKKVTARQLHCFCETYFGGHGGYAQQYLFHHARATAIRSGGTTDSSAALRSARNDKKRGARVMRRKSGRARDSSRLCPKATARQAAALPPFDSGAARLCSGRRLY